MSRIDVDDLVAAFKGQAIGQEATDLILLQKQLAQTLRSCNTPKSCRTVTSHPSPIQTSCLHHQYATYAPSSSHPTTITTPTSSFQLTPSLGAGSTVAMPSFSPSIRSRSVSRGPSRTTTNGARARSNSLVSSHGCEHDSVDYESVKEMEEVEEYLDDGNFSWQHSHYEHRTQQKYCYEQQQQQRFQLAYSRYPQQQTVTDVNDAMISDYDAEKEARRKALHS